jgi:DNA polymerase III epsilon subunit-like protein
MAGSTQGILHRSVRETPIAVIDFETTGLCAGPDRVIEVSVVRVDPGEAPRVALDTLVNPQRRVAATFVHGITDADVAGAPVFEEIAGDFVRALAGCVVASYNVYFDLAFLKCELRLAGIRRVPPHLCLMYMRPILALGERCRLDRACAAHQIAQHNAHMAATDALAAAELLPIYLERMREMGLETFADLACAGNHAFARSWCSRPFAEADAEGFAAATRLQPRRPR